MAVKIRLARTGTKKKPFYRIVAADVRSPRDGRYLEKLGIYNPCVEAKTVELVKERVQYWLDQGAQTSDTVNGLLIKAGFDIKPVVYIPKEKKPKAEKEG